MIVAPDALITPDRSGVRRRAQGPRDDRLLGAATIGLSIFGIVIIYSATRGNTDDTSFVTRQSAFFAVAVMAMFGVSRLHHRRFRGLAVPLLIATLAALALVLSPLGVEVRGTQGWLRLFGLSVQPAEFAKITLVVCLAAVLTSRHRIERRWIFIAVRLSLAVAVASLLASLVVLGGETGSVLVYGAIAGGMFVFGGVPNRLLVALGALAVVAVVTIATSGLLAPYQRDRLESFIDVDADPLGTGYNQAQSVTAIGSGGVGGKGLFNGPQTQLRYLPEQQTDFIFAVVSEELGFAGGLAVIVTQAVILFRILAISRAAANPFGALLCGGVFSLLAFQVVQNLAMNLRLLPVTGIPLPFVSYGGSSLLVGFIGIGLVQAVARQRVSPVPDCAGQAIHSLTTPGQYRLSAGQVR